MALLGPTSGTAITLNLYPGYKDSAHPVQTEVSRTFDGTLYRVREIRFATWDLPLRFVPASTAAIIQSWWTNATSLFFWEDPDTWPGSAWPVQMVNRSLPLDEWQHPYYGQYRMGEISLEARSGY